MRTITKFIFVFFVLGLLTAEKWVNGIPSGIGMRTRNLKSKWTGEIHEPNDREWCPETTANRPSVRVNTTHQIAALRVKMSQQNVSAYIVQLSDDHGSSGSQWDQRLQYITGFSGSAGYAIITMDKTALWTDGRYFYQSDQEMDCNWILMKQGQPGFPTGEEWLGSELSSGSSVGAYPNYVAINVWQSYEMALVGKGVTMEEMEKDLVDTIWDEQSNSGRPDRPNKPLIIHELEFAGRSWQQKLIDVRAKLMEESLDALAVTILEESAWLFNLRGSDRTSSLFYAYSIVLRDETRIFLQNFTALISPVSIRNHLNINAGGRCISSNNVTCINIYEYDDIMNHIRGLAANGSRVWLDPTANFASYNAAGDNRMVLRSPIALMKSVKNDVEREKFMNCIMRDSARLIQFLAFLEKEMQASDPNWSEISAADKLEEYRSKDDNFRGLSFDTISAVGPNAAIIHYRPTPGNSITDRKLTKDEVYLLDSGGQYSDGTTDVTRTMHYGKPSDTEKEAYTRVLMGAIDLATTVWPEGLYGSDFDARARTPLWQNGWDYNHGTGHGIGYWLSVHEGPGRINIGFNNMWTPIYEGMFFSDEPGYYEDGSFGIRLETLVQVVEAKTPNKFGNKKYLGFKMATLVPFEPNLIKYELLSPEQIIWLNDYNKLCLDEVGSYLRDTIKDDSAYAWVEARVKPVENMADVGTNLQLSLAFIVTFSILATAANI